ncbi:MAG TPA: hypothetical protein VFP84_39640, partial [Kofleriaceae bacterium]|nr:hypothetical protein [Kofleriaceae bacterium]
MTRWLPRGAALVALAAALACTPRTRRTPDDTVVVVIDSPINTTDPRATLSNYDGRVSKLIAPGLTAVDTPTLEP